MYSVTFISIWIQSYNNNNRIQIYAIAMYMKIIWGIMIIQIFMYQVMNDYKSIIAKNTIFVLSVCFMEIVEKYKMEQF